MPDIRRVRPTPLDGPLNHPHKGCCTFQRFNGQARRALSSHNQPEAAQHHAYACSEHALSDGPVAGKERWWSGTRQWR